MKTPGILNRLKIAFSGKQFEKYTKDQAEEAAIKVMAQYEAGVRWSGRRSYIPGWNRDARLDADTATRTELVRKSRYFERNSAILNRLCDLFEEFTVGANGLRLVPASSEQEWNQKATEWWNGWQQYCDLTTLQTWGTVQSLCARTWMVDGEIFILKTSGKIREGGQSFPRIQLIESHRVETPQQFYGDEKVIDGIRVDARGRPISYYIKDGFTYSTETYREIPAENMVHLFEPSRTGMMRGLPMTYPVLNDLHDMDDLQILEMDAAKEAAKTTTVIKTKTGELSEDDFRRLRLTIGGTQGTSGGSSQTRDQYYDDVFQGRVKVLKHNDDIAQLASTRPSVVTREYWDYLTSKVCSGVGISKLLVFPWSLQGTVTRADLEVQSAFFRSRSGVLASKFTDIYLYVMEWATRNVRELADPPADWRRVTIRPPRSVSVDVGRNSNALISEYAAGWRTLEGICGELGEDWRETLRQRAMERAKARELEKEFGLKEGELIEAALEAVKQSAAAKAPEPEPVMV